MNVFSGYTQQLVGAFIFCSMTAGLGGGIQFQALYFLLVVIFGALDETQFTVLAFIYGMVVLYNSLSRASARR